MIIRRRVPAPTDASRSAAWYVFDAEVRATARSFAQMVLAGLEYAMVPVTLALTDVVQAALELVDERWVEDARLGNVCGELLRDGGCVWVCLRPWCPSHDPTSEARVHAFPLEARRRLAHAALLEQTDPVARLERLTVFAFDPSADPLAAAGMPTA